MKKIFILDTNVLLHDAGSIFNFTDNDVVLPVVVLEELDNFKKNQDETGRNSRMVVRELDKLRNKGHINDWVTIKENGRLKVDVTDYSKEIGIEGFGKKADNLILGCVRHYTKTESRPVIFISNDINLRVKADALGLLAEGFESSHIQLEELYKGLKVLKVDNSVIDKLDSKKEIDYTDEFGEIFNNQFIMFQTEKGVSTLSRYVKDTNKIKIVPELKNIIWGIKPRNIEQRCAFDLLLDNSLELVSLCGRAGTGKTLLALACGLEAVVQRGNYDKLLICRPVVPVGKDIGYLPGDIEEKLMPRMQPISDNLEFLFAQRKNRGPVEDLEYFLNEGIIQLEPLTYIRGRSIPNQYMIVDEAQNLTPLELKTIITRAGVGTKVVLTGDPFQIDHPYLDSLSNGLSYVVEKFLSQSIFGHIMLEKGERSRLAELAAALM
ncbi:MAG: PhoH family protein [Candidatus Hydrogenedentota bacterium]